MIDFKKYFLENFKNVLIDEKLSGHCTFKVGGNADVLYMPTNIQELKLALEYLKKNQVKFFIIGNGSNLIFTDKGFNGVIIKTSKFLKNITLTNNILKAEAGASLSNICKFALENSLTGLEFSNGIPGSLGGAIFMNAGAYGGEIKDVLVEAEVMDSQGNIIVMSKDSLNLSYRKSAIEGTDFIILSGTFMLSKGKPEDIKLKMEELLFRRNDKQPINKPSGGSTFKRPKKEGLYAGKLIEDANLSGYTIGGAKVSEKHCGFVINDNNGTAKDILDLIEYIQKVVFEKFDVQLETEVKVIGE